jgi:hypothetical protein
MNTPNLTGQASQAMPADPGRPSHETPSTQPQLTEPDDGGDRPTGTVS